MIVVVLAVGFLLCGLLTWRLWVANHEIDKIVAEATREIAWRDKEIAQLQIEADSLMKDVWDVYAWQEKYQRQVEEATQQIIPLKISKQDGKAVHQLRF